MIIIHTRHFPFGNYTTINLFGILFTKNKNLSKRTINHERIHTKQMKEMLYIFFYLWYGLEYIIIRYFILNKMMLIMMLVLKKKLITMTIIKTIYLLESIMLGGSISEYVLLNRKTGCDTHEDTIFLPRRRR